MTDNELSEALARGKAIMDEASIYLCFAFVEKPPAGLECHATGLPVLIMASIYGFGREEEFDGVSPLARLAIAMELTKSFIDSNATDADGRRIAKSIGEFLASVPVSTGTDGAKRMRSFMADTLSGLESMCLVANERTKGVRHVR